MKKFWGELQILIYPAFGYLCRCADWRCHGRESYRAGTHRADFPESDVHHRGADGLCVNCFFCWQYALCQAGIASPKTTYARCLLEANDGQMISDDEQKTASLLCNAAIEARVLGLPEPAMSITGSGAHGIIATMPLYAAYKVRGYSEEMLLRATALSYLVCMYIKEYSGKLSAFCGCAIAAGTGMACGLVLLRGGSTKTMAHTINNLASSITGMICDGGNQGCTMKGIVAVDAAWQAVSLAEKQAYIYNVHGINGAIPEQTMQQHGADCLPRYGGNGKDDCGDFGR